MSSLLERARRLTAALAACAFLHPVCESAAAPAAGVGAPTATAAPSSSTWNAGNYEFPFKTSWEDGKSEGLQHLEHVNVAVPSHEPSKRVYYELLGLVPDARKAANVEKGSGTIWANIGVSQIHLPEGEPQVVPGTIGLVYSDLSEVLSRLNLAGRDALEGSSFAWKESSDGNLDITCPYGNKFLLHKRNPPPPGNAAQGEAPLDARGGRLPNVPSDASFGLGLAYVHLRVRPGTSAGIARFYREMFGADAEEVGAPTDTGEPSCSVTGTNDGGARQAGTVVRVGPVQHLAFMERELALPEYDGHHICLYLTDEAFRLSFLEAERRGLVFVNPRRNYGKADNLEKALEEKQYRIKNIVDPATGELLHVLEHEIRCISHPSYPVGRDLSIEA